MRHYTPSSHPLSLLVLMLCAALWSGGSAAHAQEPSTPPPTATAFAPEEFLALTNEAREANGVGLLAWNEQLAEAAQQHADDIAQRADPSHTGSDGSTPQDRAARAGYPAYPDGVRVSENWSTGTAFEAMTYFIEDQIHRDNMLLPLWREMGAGRADWSGGGELWVVVYGAQPGVLPIFVEGGAEQTVERDVTVQLSEELAGFAPERFTVPIEMRVAEEAVIDEATWQPWAPEMDLTLSSEGGDKTIIAELRDAQGNVVQSMASIFLVAPDGPVPTARVQLAPTLTASPTHTSTPTVTPSPTPTQTPTPTMTPTVTPTPTPLPLFLPLPEGNDPILLLIGSCLVGLGLIFALALLIARRPRR